MNGYTCPRCGAWVSESQTHSCYTTNAAPSVNPGWACTSSGHEFEQATTKDRNLIFCRKCGEVRQLVPGSER